MAVREYLAGAGSIFGAKVNDGQRDSSIVYFDGRTVASDENVKVARKRWLEASADDFDELGGGVYADRGSGLLYRRAQGQPLLGGDDDVSVFYVVDDPDGGQIVCLEKTGATIDGLDQADQADQARQAAEEKDRRRALERQPQTQVWWGQTAGNQPVSLRDTILSFEESGGRIGLDRSGGLALTIPERLTEGTFMASIEHEQKRQLAAQAEVIVACRGIVEAALRARSAAKTGTLADAIPAGSVTVTGGVA